jgi:peptidoglycan/xylan/chitin deacetylase (PgdA/CDA1 family)
VASHTISGQAWPDGTTVGVYPAVAVPAGSDVPSGTAVTTAVVASGAVTFSGLSEKVRYYAYASGVGRSFLISSTLKEGDRARIEALESEVGPVSGSRVDSLEGRPSAGVLQLPQQSRESVLSTFQAGHGFTGNGVGTFSDQATSVNGTQAFQIQTNGAAADSIATKTGLTPVSLVGRFVKLMMQVNGGGNLSYARLRLASGVIATDYAEATVYDNSVAGSALNNGLWNAQTVGVGDFAVTGLVDWSQITSAQLILRDTGAVGRILFNLLSAVPGPAMPIVSICFDDARPSPYTMALPRLSQYRFPASAYIIADAVDTAGALTSTQLQALRDTHGWDMEAHSATTAAHNGLNGFKALSSDALRTELRTVQQWLRERGFPGDHLAWPQGQQNAALKLAAREFYRGARGTPDGVETFPPRDLFNLRAVSVAGLSATLAGLKAYVDQAIASRGWLILTFHDIVSGAPATDTDFQQSNFNALVDYIAASGAAVMTVGDVLKQPANAIVAAQPLTKAKAQLPRNAIDETVPRYQVTGSSTPTSGTLRLCGSVLLPAGVPVKSITFVSDATALSAGTHQWFSLVRQSDLAVLAKTVNDTSTAWAVNVPKTLALSATYTPQEDTLAYVGVLIVATTPPALVATSTKSQLVGMPPYLGGQSTTGLTDPASLGATAAAVVTSVGSVPYATVA